jgi:two-component system LytT family sensor kinase
MNKRLLHKAFQTSPLVSIYVVLTIALFDTFNLEKAFIRFIAFTLSVFVFWLINIYLFKQSFSKLKRYILSYSIVLLLHLLALFFRIQTTEIQRILFTIITALAINSIIIIIINSVIHLSEKTLIQIENKNLIIENLEAQKHLLIQQLHPHFLFNTLSTLKSLIKNQPTLAEDFTIKLSEFLRYSISTQTSDLVYLKDELQFTDDYIELQKVRFGNAILVSRTISNDKLTYKLPPFALQSLVENAIKHNFFSENKPLQIEIKEENSSLKVTNNKSIKPIKNISGIGLNNLNERYKTISGYSIQIIETELEFTVIINLLNK